MSAHPPMGSVVAGYRLLSLVGEGATGAVHLAQRDGERAAVKLLCPEFAADQRFRRRPLRESTLAAGLRHPQRRAHPRLR